VPTFNGKYDGVKENCYTYLMELMSKQVMDDTYGWDMVKFDSCKDKVESKWSQGGHLPNEAYFIENPQGESEDDGVILSIAYDFVNEGSKLLVVDPKTMTTLQEYPLPFSVPWSFHSGYWR
jgi:beta,beta-carotene 9',10'-dioxygenase